LAARRQRPPARPRAGSRAAARRPDGRGADGGAVRQRRGLLPARRARGGIVSGGERRLRDIGDMPSVHVERRPAGPLAPATYREPARDVPVRAAVDVAVVGGGPAGTAAAVAAARLGADVLLIERYGHLGGLSTGGLVIWIDRMADWSGRQVLT